MSAVCLSLWDGNPYTFSPVSILSSRKGSLGVKKTGAWNCRERKALPRMCSNALYGHMSAKDSYSPENTGSRTVDRQIENCIQFYQMWDSIPPSDMPLVDCRRMLVTFHPSITYKLIKIGVGVNCNECYYAARFAARTPMAFLNRKFKAGSRNK